MVAGQVFQCQQRNCRVAAATAQSRTHGNIFFEFEANPAFKPARSLPQMGGPVNQVIASRAKLFMVALEPDAFPARGDEYLQAVSKPNGLINGANFVEAVRTFGEDFESEVNLGKGAGLDGFGQAMRQARPILEDRKTNAANRFAPLILSHGAGRLADLALEAVHLLAEFGGLLRVKVPRHTLMLEP